MSDSSTTDSRSGGQKPSQKSGGMFSFMKHKEKSGDGPGEVTVSEKDVEVAAAPKKEEAPSVSFLQMFRFATRFEAFVNVVGLIAAGAAGAGEPLMSLIFGNLTNTFVQYQLALQSGNPEALAQASSQFIQTTSLDACWLVLIGGVIMICSYIYTCAWNYTGESISKRVRELYFKSVLRQDIAYFDEMGAGEVTTHIETDTHLFQQGISEKNAFVIRNFACFVSGFVIAYARSWRLALVLTTVIPCIVLAGSIMTMMVSKYVKHALGHVSEGASIAEEVLSSVRTVQAFGTQNVLIALYRVPIELAHRFELKSATANGIGISAFLFIVYSEYALAFVYGTTLVIDNIGQVGTVLNVIFAILLGSFSLGQVAAEIQPILQGRAAAAKLYVSIDRVPAIDSQSPEGQKPTSVHGEIRLEDVSFHYPSRPDVPVARNLNLSFPAGKTVALVGASGSGKSTIVSLVERFYDPIEGKVTLDGINIRDLNIKWLRGQISLVSQEPVLFRDSIADNVALGLIGTPHEHASYEEKLKLVKEACIKANADSFISRLPEGYQTLVGERGFLLSGGQKQRIAIARAVVSDPKILLLDEATSALDTQSEGVVQDALDKAAAGRTTITIAHRLSTIKNADKIYVMGQGMVLEEGTHDELLQNRDGPYSKLVEAQKLRESSEKTLDDTDASEEDVIVDKEKIETQSNDKADDSSMNDRKSMSRSQVDVTVQNESIQDNGGVFTLFFRICKMDKSLIRQYLIGAIFACLQGTVFPAYGILMGSAINSFSSDNNSTLRFDEDRNALWFFIIALLSMGIVAMEHLHFGRASANVMTLLRVAQFKAMLRQDIRYFDEDDHSTGVLVSRLSDNPQKINGLLGTTAATILQGFSTLVAGWIVGLIYSWRVALVGIACEPFIVTVGYIRLQVLGAKDRRNRHAHEESAQFACESAAAIRTVASLTREENCLVKYSERLDEPLRESVRTAAWANALFAFAQSSTFYVVALLFWFGSKEIVAGNLATRNFFVVIFSVVFAATEAGAIWQFAPDISSAGSAARDVNNLLTSIPEIDSESKEGVILKDVQGEIRLDDVQFRYPTRLGVRVLRGLDLKVEPGTYIALVGASGCGKSTVIQLIERFYDPIAGRVLLDGQDISQMNVQEYRKHIALVSQEPTLYAGTIKFNILLGATKPESEVTQQELEDACRNANILEFIKSLPNGFETNVGGKGSQLSGGQKQRIAIARALIRNPRVLLLDEATSALDSNSEKVVQEALDKAAKGRTTIAIAHRLSTIQNADRIYFIKEGRVSECGTHDELLALQGGYYEYVQLQALSKK